MGVLQTESKRAIREHYRSYRRDFPEFVFNQPGETSYPLETFTMSVAEEMAEESRITDHVMDISHRKYLGWMIVLIKKTLRIIAFPFIKIIFIRQQRFNDLNVSLAYSVASLEHRLAQLESLRSDQKGMQVEHKFPG